MLLVRSPGVLEIYTARTKAGLTQRAAADLVHATASIWLIWETGATQMSEASWTLFLLATGQHPSIKLHGRIGMEHNTSLLIEGSSDRMRVKEARARAGLSTQAAAAFVGKSTAAWSNYEAGYYRVPTAVWTLFLLFTGQHPTSVTCPK